MTDRNQSSTSGPGGGGSEWADIRTPAAPPAPGGARGNFWGWLYSLDLVLWLLGLLVVAMAIGTVIPQKAGAEAYQHAFGTALGGLIARSSLPDVFGAWWFTGMFVLLAVNLAACAIRRGSRLLRGQGATGALSAAQVRARRVNASWNLKLQPAAALEQLTQALRRRGYRVAPAPAEGEGGLALRARRGGARPWGPVLVHVGMVGILLGAAYGRLPGRPLDTIGNVKSDAAYTVPLGKDSFDIRLLDAGSEVTPTGVPSKYWAKTQIVVDDKVIRDVMISPNHPLRYKGTNIVLNSMSTAPSVAVEVKTSAGASYIPIDISGGQVVSLGMNSFTRLETPRWAVWISDFRNESPDGSGPAAQVRVDETGMVSKQRRDIGWVGAGGLDYKGVHFELVATPGGKEVQLGVHRDPGVPIVWGGFIVVVAGCLLAAFMTQREVAGTLTPRGNDRTAVALGASAFGLGPGAENIVRLLGEDLGARQEVDK